MIWTTWRRFRAQALTGLGALLLLAVYLLVLGEQIRSGYRADLARCGTAGGCAGALDSLTGDYGLQIDLLGYLLLAVPGALGIFWGAPLVARELEAGTHRLVWNQSVTRSRWLAAQLGLVGLTAVAVTGLGSALLSRAAGPLDQIGNDRFTPVLFAARGIAPLGYAAFAFALGATLGLLLRRTVPAMALTLVLFAAVQIVVPNLVRPHYSPAVRASVPLTAPAITDLTMIGSYGELQGLTVPGGPWVISTSTMLDAAGRPVGHSAWYQGCLNAGLTAMPTCLAAGHLHVDVTEQPADRYWTFQWYETALFAALAALLTALCFARIRGRLG